MIQMDLLKSSANMPKQQQKQYINIWNMLKMYNKDTLVHILLHFFWP